VLYMLLLVNGLAVRKVRARGAASFLLACGCLGLRVTGTGGLRGLVLNTV
jgi:hypothetical protein